MVDELEREYLRGRLAQLLLEERIAHLSSGRVAKVKAEGFSLNIEIASDDLIEILSKLNSLQAEFPFDYLDGIFFYSKDDEKVLMYEILSSDTWQRVSIRATVGREQNEVCSASPLFPAALFYERLIASKHGISFRE